MGTAASAAEFHDSPWALRPHYEFQVGKAVLRYAGDNAEWEMVQDGPGAAYAQRIGMAVRLADGSEFNTASFEPGTDGRQRGSTPQGDGVLYYVDMRTSNDLVVRHGIFVNTNFPFYLVEVSVTNDGAKPIEVASVDPVIFRPGSFAGLSPEAKVTPRGVSLSGRWPTLNPQGAPLSIQLADAASNFTFMMGLLPEGTATSTPQLFKSGAGWQGGVRCTFDPPVVLAPGERLRADPVWVSFATPNSNEVETFFAWAHSEALRDAARRPRPQAWITAEPYSAFTTLQSAMATWLPAGVNHVLVPEGWEGRPGSLAGAQPRYPRDLKRVARTIRSSEAIPGLTVDPLTAIEGDPAWSVLSDDGQRWVNLRHSGGRAYALRQMKEVASWGYKFYVVKPSPVPAQVLHHFSMTREQALTLAMEVMAEAAPDAPVMPMPTATLGADIAPWQRASAHTQQLRGYNVPFGPVRLDVSQKANYDKDFLKALGGYAGPIELSGRPRPSVRRILTGFFGPSKQAYGAVPNQRQVMPALPEDDTLASPISTDGQRAVEGTAKDRRRGGRFRGLLRRNGRS
jgi:hypothetical protein